MTGYEPVCLCLLRNIGVRRSMVAHTYDVIALIPLVWHRVDPPLEGYRRMKGRFKHADHACVRHDMPELADGFQIRAVVGRRHKQTIAHAVQHGLIELMNAVKPFGKHSFESNGADLARGCENAVLLRCHVRQEHFYAGRVVRYAEPLLA